MITIHGPASRVAILTSLLQMRGAGLGSGVFVVCEPLDGRLRKYVGRANRSCTEVLRPRGAERRSSTKSAVQFWSEPWFSARKWNFNLIPRRLSSWLFYMCCRRPAPRPTDLSGPRHANSGRHEDGGVSIYVGRHYGSSEPSCLLCSGLDSQLHACKFRLDLLSLCILQPSETHSPGGDATLMHHLRKVVGVGSEGTTRAEV